MVSATDLSVMYGADQIFENVSLDINEHARIGIVGPNGSGKTSLLKIIVKELEPDSGSVHWSRGLQLSYVPQTPPHSANGTLKDEVTRAFHKLLSLEHDLEASALDLEQSGGGKSSEVEDRYAAQLRDYESLGGYTYENEMERMVDALGLGQDALKTQSSWASGGERTRASLARALLSRPDLLVLDEPTNHLDLKGVGWLESFLSKTSSAVVLVSHDRYFLDKAVNQIWELDYGRLETYPGNYSAYRRLKEERTSRRQQEYQRQQEYIAKEQDFIRRYHAGQRSKEARGRETRLERLERIDRPNKDGAISIGNLAASRTGQIVLSTRNLKVGYADDGIQTHLLSPPDLKLERGSRTAMIGDNGVGKTALLKTILGFTAPLGGSVELGHNVAVGYYRQGQEDLPEESTVLDALLDVKNLPLGEARSYLARFLFQGEDVFKSIASCSGGERSRLTLACLMLSKANFLILDEPTTHFDIPSREAVEKVLLDYQGSILLVSHDRHFVSLLAEALWVVGGGTVTPFRGTFEEWAESQAEVSQATHLAKSIPQKKSADSQDQPRTPSRPNPIREELMLSAIDGLEKKLADVENRLETAAQDQDLTAVASLGQEYDETRAELERKLEEWIG